MSLFKKKTPGMSASMMSSSLDESFVSLQDDSRYSKQSILSILINQKSRRALRRHWKAKREAKVVRKSAKYVDKYVSELTEGRPFLQNTPNQPIAKFRRSEIIVRARLGKGTFVRVYDIKDFDLQEAAEEDRRSSAASTRLQLIQEFENDNQESKSMRLQPGALNSIPESSERNGTGQGDVDEGEISDGIGRSDLASTGTLSTAPQSAPSTPSSSRSRGNGIASNGTSSQSRLSLRDSTNSTSYRRGLLKENELKREQSTLRLEVRDDLRNGKANYSLKHLTSALLRNPKEFYLAAAALLMEAKYLSKLDHPNIIKLKGLAMGDGSSLSGPASRRGRYDAESREGFESGHYDSYFLISERLTDTLDRRIRQWKKDQPTQKKLSEQTSEQKIQTWKLMMRKTSYALQISNALHYLHSRNLLYRDLKPQNIGFVGDNQTIAIFNFGLCRELDPGTGKVTQDEVTALYGAASWRYTAVECFAQDFFSAIGETLAQGTRLLSHSTRSAGLDLSSSGSSRFAKHSRHKKQKAISLNGMEPALHDIQEQAEDVSSQGSATSAPLPSKDSVESSGLWDGAYRKPPCYDVKVDVYSWAMVYYEMLTTNVPFAKMSQREHLSHVCGKTLDGYEGGQRPGIYQYDLMPSMISLLQRAWDQNPNKRPTMESIGRNLQTILRELEELIKEEQRKMALAISAGCTETVPVSAEQKQLEQHLERQRGGDSCNSDIDIAALEYEIWDDFEEKMEDEEVSEIESSDDSSMPGDESDADHRVSPGQHAEQLATSTASVPDDEESDNDNAPDAAVAGSAPTPHMKKSLSTRNRASINQNGALRRMRTKSSMGTFHRTKSRRLGSDSMERRWTHRVSRRTIRLSRQSMWLLQQDRKVVVFVGLIALVALAGMGVSGYYWYQRKKNSLLGFHLDELKGLNRTEVMDKLRGAIEAKCQRDLPPIENPDLPLLFQGGALTPYDEDCMEGLQQDLDKELVLKLNLTEPGELEGSMKNNTNSTIRECGFLNIHSFEPPPPTKRKRRSKWQRKRQWKFFRDD